MRKKALYVVILPVALLMAISEGSIRTQEEQGIFVTGTISGLFYNPANEAFTFETLPLVDPPKDGVTRYYVDEEAYYCEATITEVSDAEPFKVDWGLVTSYDMSNSQWNATVTPLSYSGGRLIALSAAFVVGAQKRITIKIEYEKKKGEETIRVVVEITLEGKKEPPPGSVRITSILADADKPPEERFKKRCYSSGKIWQKKSGKNFPFQCPVDPGYVILQNIPVADDYTGQAVMEGWVGNEGCLGPVRCLPPTFDVRPDAGTDIAFLFWKHKGVKGKVRYEAETWNWDEMTVAFEDISIVELSRPDGEKITTTASYSRHGRNWIEGNFFIAYPKSKGGLYDLVIRPAISPPSGYRWEPLEYKQPLSIPDCEYSRPTSKPYDSWTPCSQATTRDLGLVVTFRAVKDSGSSGSGGSGDSGGSGGSGGSGDSGGSGGSGNPDE